MFSAVRPWNPIRELRLSAVCLAAAVFALPACNFLKSGSRAADPKAATIDNTDLSLANSTLTLDANEADPGEVANVTLTLLDGLGNAYTKTAPNLSLSLGGGSSTATISDLTAGSPGVFTATLTATGFGGTTATLSAAVVGVGVLTTTQPFTVHITSAPPPFVYATPVATYTRDVDIADNTVIMATGAPVDSYAILPALPVGFVLDPLTGKISGHPVAISSAQSFTVTATNTAGSRTGTVSIRVIGQAPSGLNYSATTFVAPRSTAFTSGAPTLDAGDATITYAVSPALPTGLSINPATGVISGTPSVYTAAATYTVTATNSSGSTSCALTITVERIVPNTLTYTLATTIYSQNTAITANNAVSNGDTPKTYTISPAIPAGLSFNSSTGAITGTPTVAAAAANYTVTVTNTGGSKTTVLNITINPAPPATFNYASATPTYTRTFAITANTITTSAGGGPVASYSISPALPAGLLFNSVTGTISGTPSIVSPSTAYTVTATNSGGSTSNSVTILINPAPPTGLSYTSNSPVYTRNTAITTNTPSHSGGDNPVSYAVSPALPTGLSLDTTTGLITGTPTVQQAAAAYVVTATNAGGSGTRSLSITVKAIAPTGLSYDTTPATYTRNTAIASNSPSTSGGDAPTSYAISPSLPTGLSLNTSTGVISGTPSVLHAASSYTVTATNTGGSTTASVNITVQAAAPTGMSYSASPIYARKNVAIASASPTISGGDVPASYAVSPSLPTGLALNATTGVISGTPTVGSEQSTYTITGTNVSGSTTANVDIEVFASESSLAFDGSGDLAASSATMDSLIGAASPTAFTFSAWIKMNSVSVDTAVGGAASSGLTDGFGLYWSSSTTLRFFVNGSGNYAEATVGSPSGWNHVVAVFNSSLGSNQIKLYINGSLAASGTEASALADTSMALTLGALDTPTTTAYMDGYLDDVALWNTALGSSAVSAIYNSAKPSNLRVDSGAYTSSSALRAFWRMGDYDTLPSVIDHGSSGSDLSVTDALFSAIVP